jgi:uncharacterized membrane-anchored protein/uncharacterized membrane protein
MQQNAVRLGYFLAISLLLSSLLYFFASNWPALDRWEKIGVSVSVLALFYCFSYVGALVLKRHAFISNWLLVAGGLSFGVSVALLGQIYNSHADSYMLFAVWLVPNLLFAFLTRYQPFYVISYVLAHLAIWFFLDPSVIHVTREDEWWYLVCWLIGLFNIGLFWATSTERLRSPSIYYLSFSVFSLLEYYSEVFFLIALLAAAGVVWATVAGLKWLRQSQRRQESTWIRFFQEAFTVLITLVASSIGAISLTGLLVLIFEGDEVIYFLFFLSLVGFIAPVIFNPKMNSTVRYTLLTMGYMLGVGSSLYIEGYFWVLFLLVLAYAWFAIKSIPARLLTQLVFLLVFYSQLDNLISDKVILLIVFVSQMAMYAWPRLPTVLRNSSLCYALLSLLALTEFQMSNGMSIVANLAFFAISTYLLYRTLHTNGKWDFGIALGFWFAFLMMKYYDFLWSLLHKSLSLLLISLLFFAASYWLDRRTKEESAHPLPPIFAGKRLVLVPVILLQFAFIGYQVWSSESILTQGKTVKLELEPVDPRSLLQGDYVQLGYTISRLGSPDLLVGENIRVVLRMQENGLYEYSGYYEQAGVWNKPYQADPNDVIINGRTIGGDRVEYGIENYFVPEGTGLELERTAKYSYVKVGKKGDAILESLSAK